MHLRPVAAKDGSDLPLDLFLAPLLRFFLEVTSTLIRIRNAETPAKFLRTQLINRRMFIF